MTLSLVFIAISALICLFAPAALALYMIRKRGAWPPALLLGAAVFTVFQILTRVPLLGWLQTTAGFTLFAATRPLLYVLVLALSAGVFEEAGRYIAARTLAARRLTWKNAVVFGLGHGGIEALWLVGVNYAVLFVQALGGQHTASILSAPPTLFLAAGVERLLAVTLHVAFTMLIFCAVRRRKPPYLPAAVGAHAAVDAALPLLGLAGAKLGVWEGEGVLAVLAALAVWLIVKMKPVLTVPSEDEGGD